MRKGQLKVCFLLAFMLMACSATVQAGQSLATGSRVEIVRHADGSFTLMRNGEPYLARGAGIGSGEHLAMLKASGGNSVRTWGVNQLEQVFDGKPFLDYAHELGISVAAGYWVDHVRHGYDYGDPVFIARQRRQVREMVLKYKDHPALLVWSLGNEMEEFGQAKGDDRIWKELNYLAGMIKELDPHHPVMTVIASTARWKIKAILELYPNLDILGVNSYGGAGSVGRSSLEAGWDGPYMLTEFGASGTWEVGSTSWGAPIEPSPGSKAAATYSVYRKDRDNNVGRSFGSYVFFWGNKQEATSSWYGMFLPGGEKSPRVDAMAYAWSGKWPKNRAPKLRSLKTPVARKKVRAGKLFNAEADIIDREGDQLSYVWDIREESSDRKQGGDAEAAPPSVPNAIKKGQGTPRIEFMTPKQAGAYRIFVSAFDGQGGALVYNLPFYVED